jgi:CRP-like cAMP-binding protein
MMQSMRGRTRDGVPLEASVLARNRAGSTVDGRAMRLDGLSAGAQVAWANSFFSRLPDDVGERLLVDAWELAFPSGAYFYRGTHHEETAKVGLVVSGLLRTLRRSPDGRQVTLRYAHECMIIGLPIVLGRDADVDGEALVDSRVLALRAETFRSVAMAEACVAWEVATYMAGVVAEAQAMLSDDLFLPVRNRVARHLLDMAAHEDSRLVVHASQQDLADAIGSVREVVARALRLLAESGYIERDASGLIVRDAAALHRIAIGVL